MENSNLQIIGRLLELARNPIEYTVFPNDCRKENIFLANVLNDSKARLQHEFDEAFKYAVGNYNASLRENKGYGWFHSPEKLVWLDMSINQLNYAIYGEKFVHQIQFKKELGKRAYLDLINQIDRTVLMTPKQIQRMNAKINKMALEILAEIEDEEKKNTK